MRISDWSSDVCSSDLRRGLALSADQAAQRFLPHHQDSGERGDEQDRAGDRADHPMQRPPPDVGAAAPHYPESALEELSIGPPEPQAATRHDEHDDPIEADTLIP